MAENYKKAENKTEIMKQIGINLEKLKKALGWTQARMADLTGIAEPTMANYLRGERLPGIDYLVGLCTMREIKEKDIYLSIDNLLSNNFDPERAQQVKNRNMDDSETVDRNDFVGTYLCYFYDQTMQEQEDTSFRKMRLGVLSVYDDYNCATAEKKIKAYAVFMKDDLKRATEIKEELDLIYKSAESIAQRNEELLSYYADLEEGPYTGDVVFSNQHVFVNICSGIHSDNALMVFYSPRKRADNDYIGGMGSVASVATGGTDMPAAQKIIISRYELGCSFEEIFDYLSMSSAPVSQREETLAIVEICKNLYDKDEPMSSLLKDEDKYAIIEKRLIQLVRNYVEKSVCCVGTVSVEEDKKVYSLIKKYAK